jgi:predicted ATP-grasp superfamily ATP-dependent carboligase
MFLEEKAPKLPRLDLEMPVAFVLGLGINGLGVVRSLGRVSVHVVGFYSFDEEIGRFSRYCQAVHLAPDITPDKMLKVILEVSDHFKAPPVLYATTDAYAQWINDYQHQLCKRFLFHSVEKSLFAQINTKLGLIHLVKEHGIQSPWTDHFERLEEIEQAASGFPYPVIVKPVNTFDRILPDGAKNVIFEDVHSLLSYVSSHPDYLGNMIFQEVIPSGDGNVYICTVLMDEKSNLLLSYTGRKIRQYKPDYGVTCFGVSERIEALVALCNCFMHGIGYRGIATLEFVKDRNTGRFLFIEINPRSYYHNQLFYDCGLNFPWVEYCVLTGRSRGNLSPKQRDGIHWLDFNKDLASFYLKCRSGKLRIGEWTKTLLKSRSFATLALDDFKPFAYQNYILLQQIKNFFTH